MSCIMYYWMVLIFFFKKWIYEWMVISSKWENTYTLLIQLFYTAFVDLLIEMKYYKVSNHYFYK